MLNSHWVTPAAVIVKKFFMILQMTIFLFFTLSTRKIGSKLSLQKIKFAFPLTLVLIVSAGRPLFDSQQLAFLLVEWVGKNTHYSLPHPFALFLLASSEGRLHSLNAWKRLFDMLQSRSTEHFCFIDNINENNVSPVQ